MNKLAILITLGLVSGVGYAGGEQVNCRTQTVGKQAIYEGWAACEVGAYTLSRYIPATPVRWHTIYEQRGSSSFSCDATVPFSHYENVTKRVCDRKPYAKISVNNNVDLVNILFKSHDPDGRVVSHRVWVNDSELTGFNMDADRAYYVGTINQTINIRVRAIDNDGYYDEVTQTYKISCLNQPHRCGVGL
ncbi:hypothetical protein [Pseudoalteromonas rubra]|uniref:Uncharacterized protein n=1 Tax=Pseudoalteromonas rubra TaxID=43658 RepID=A0A5S3X0M6_9GAMM|nr:hypothetical protein [Pseudoalteromonas rubra]TMP36563.1 hypothetical protein CWB98_13105 [Pseudoalteromonas rubra]